VIAPHGGGIRVEPVSTSTPDVAATVTLSDTAFFDLYERRLNLTFAHFSGVTSITGSARLATSLLMGLFHYTGSSADMV
jgi:hypothetical protein